MKVYSTLPSAVLFSCTESKFGETVNLKVNSFDAVCTRLLVEKVVLQEWSRSTLNSIPVPFVVSSAQFYDLPHPP